MRTILVLSIKEKHAQDILGGSKKVEFRRIRPRLEKGDIVLIYAPRPIMALVGGFAVNKVIAAQPEKLWKQVGGISGLTKNQFTQYYSGSSMGFGICIDTTWRLGKPMALAVLKRSWFGFSPPQCFRYLRADEVRKARSSTMNLLPNPQLV